MASAETVHQGPNGHRAAMRGAPQTVAPMQGIIESALKNQHFYMVYQPQFSLASGKLNGFEALVRCQSPEFGVISPADFIPYAESSGEIVAIGRWIFKQALLDLKSLYAKGLRDVYMSINLSPAQLAAGDVFESLMMHLLDLGIPPHCVKIELTETALIQNSEIATRTFSAFQNEGISVWLDDFGTGFASLNLLREFNIDGLKIDKSFVEGMHRNDNDFTLCSAIIAMAQRLGLEVIAEGVEEALQMQILGQLGCDRVQGYLLGKPEKLDICVDIWGPKASRNRNAT